MFGERDDPYAVLSKLAQRLQETAVPGETLPAITATICETLKLPYAAIVVQTAGGERNTVAASGRRPGAPGDGAGQGDNERLEEWPLRHHGQLIGWLVGRAPLARRILHQARTATAAQHRLAGGRHGLRHPPADRVATLSRKVGACPRRGMEPEVAGLFPTVVSPKTWESEIM